MTVVRRGTPQRRGHHTAHFAAANSEPASSHMPSHGGVRKQSVSPAAANSIGVNRPGQIHARSVFILRVVFSIGSLIDSWTDTFRAVIADISVSRETLRIGEVVFFEWRDSVPDPKKGEDLLAELHGFLQALGGDAAHFVEP